MRYEKSTVPGNTSYISTFGLKNLENVETVTPIKCVVLHLIWIIEIACYDFLMKIIKCVDRIYK